VIEISGVQIMIGLGVFIAGIVAQTGMLFYWGGSITQICKDHERRLNKIEKRLD